MDRRAGNRKPYERCLALAGSAAEAWAAVEGVFARSGIDTRGFSLRRWLIVYEALLRERMDAEQAEDFDLQLASVSDEERTVDEKRELMLRWGGETG